MGHFDVSNVLGQHLHITGKKHALKGLCWTFVSCLEASHLIMLADSISTLKLAAVALCYLSRERQSDEGLENGSGHIFWIFVGNSDLSPSLRNPQPSSIKKLKQIIHKLVDKRGRGQGRSLFKFTLDSAHI